MDLKKLAAQEAVSLIENNMVVGLGAGSTIAFLVDFLEQRLQEGLQFQLVTSSFSTLQLLIQKKLPLVSRESIAMIDIYFDGCDQLDPKLNALKSGGGIHTQEKLLATMAKQFVLIGDEAKLVESFDVKFPLVLELLPQSATYVPYKINQLFAGTNSTMRINDKKDGPVITENGNYLLDVFFQQWPALSTVDPAIKSISGVVETSLFFNIAQRAIIAGANGVTILEK